MLAQRDVRNSMAFQLDSKDGAELSVLVGCYTLCRPGNEPRGLSRYEINRVTTRWCGQHIPPPRLCASSGTHTRAGVCFVFTLPSPFSCGFVSKEKRPKKMKNGHGVNSFVCLPNCVTSHKICQSFCKKIQPHSLFLCWLVI